MAAEENIIRRIVIMQENFMEDLVSMECGVWGRGRRGVTYAHALIIQARCWSICSLLMFIQANTYANVVEMTNAPTTVRVAMSPPKACSAMIMAPALEMRDNSMTV